jgi:hypothetical protein
VYPFSSTGIVEYFEDYCVLNIDQGISDYYRSLIPKSFYVKPQMKKAHITIVRKGKEKVESYESWGKYSGKILTFSYSPIIQSDNTYFWLDSVCSEVGSIRKELGLNEYRDDTYFGGVKRNCYHITIGNIKDKLIKGHHR